MGLHYQEYGDKNAPLIVFLHGGGVSSWMWDKQVQYFRHYHCITIDLPEQGGSKYTENFTIQLSAEKINELIEKIANGKKVIVVRNLKEANLRGEKSYGMILCASDKENDLLEIIEINGLEPGDIVS